MDTYNGWTNYATWRVNLELADDYIESLVGEDVFKDEYELSEIIKEFCENCITREGTLDGLAIDYALAFMEDVNWEEIAEGAVASYPQLIESDEDEEK